MVIRWVKFKGQRADSLRSGKRESETNAEEKRKQTMNCFQLIKTVLDEAYAAIPGNEKAKDASISAALDELSKEYADLLSKGCINYSQPCKRYAYIFRYTTSHANIVYTIIRGSATLRSLFDRDKLTVACVGGGPGSDFLGILKYCMEYEKRPELKALILDRDPVWSESWSDVDDKIGPSFRISTIFHPLDVTNPSSWKTYTKHLNADLFSLIYFMSELYAAREKAQDYFENLFTHMKPGAVVLFADNNYPAFRDWFDSLASGCGVAIHETDETEAQMPNDEEKKDLGEHYAKFGSPKLTANIAYRVGVKT